MSAGPAPLYSERIALRRQLWWKGGGAAEHDRSACRRPLPCDPATGRGPRADDPAWHCCRHWQRRLSNKWNARLFAAAHGVAVPALLWHGRDVDALPWDALPERFVIKPNLGEANRGVLVMDHGRELLRGLRLPRVLLPAYLRRVLARGDRNRRGHAAGAPPVTELLIEELVRDAGGGDGVPDAYKLHVFGGKVLFINVQRRTRAARWPFRTGAAARSYHHPDWSLLDAPPVADARQDPDWRPPPGADALIEAAERLGQAYGTYVRVDLFLSAAGPVFGEFSPTSGLRGGFLPAADRWLGDVWQRQIPDAV